MAIIKCPKCNEEVSDKSKKCIHCGNSLVEEKKLLCAECGSSIKKGSKACEKCGCPVKEMEEIIKENEHSKKVKITKKKIIIISIISLLIIGGIVAALLIKNNIDKTNAEKYRNEYKHNLRLVTYQMLYGASDAEKCGNKINSVWHNSIWKKDDPETDKYTKTNGIFNEDFNDSLNALFLDSEYIDLTDKIEDNQTEVNRLMKLLKNPSDEFVEAYSDLKDYYDSYFNLTNLCTNPSGSLQTYSSNFSDADNDTIIKYNKMKNYLDN